MLIAAMATANQVRDWDADTEPAGAAAGSWGARLG